MRPIAFYQTRRGRLLILWRRIERSSRTSVGSGIFGFLFITAVGTWTASEGGWRWVWMPLYFLLVGLLGHMLGATAVRRQMTRMSEDPPSKICPACERLPLHHSTADSQRCIEKLAEELIASLSDAGPGPEPEAGHE